MPRLLLEIIDPMLKVVHDVDDLPRMGANETPTLDFKQTVDPTNLGELAKDIAAFANASGGTIIVGAVEENEKLTRYEPLRETVANEIKRAYDHALRDRCAPRPVVETHTIPLRDRFVVAVNVKPFEGQPVAVVLPKGERASAECYWFPQRSGTHTVPLAPDELPRFMLLNDQRKIAGWLAGIPEGERVLQLQVPSTNRSLPFIETEVRMELDLASIVQRNAVKFKILASDHCVTIPADTITRVWRDAYRWRVHAEVGLRKSNRGELIAIPLRR